MGYYHEIARHWINADKDTATEFKARLKELLDLEEMQMDVNCPNGQNNREEIEFSVVNNETSEVTHFKIDQYDILDLLPKKSTDTRRRRMMK